MVNKILQATRNKHILSLAGNASAAVLGFLSFGLLARTVEKDVLGNWFIFLTAFNFIEMLRTGVIHTSMIKFSAGANQEESNKVTGSAWAISLFITTFFLFVSLVCFFFKEEITNIGFQTFIIYFGIASLCTLPLNFATWALQAELRFGAILIVRILNQGLFILFIFIAQHQAASLSLFSILLYYVLSNVITSIVCIFMGWSAVKKIKYATKQHISKLFHFGKYSMGTMMGSNLLRSSDTLLIGAFMGPAAVAVYSVPLKLIEIIEIPLRSFLATAMPMMAVAVNNNDLESVAQTLKKYAGMLTILLLPVFLFTLCFSELMVTILAGAKYASSANLLRFFISYAILLPMDRFAGVTLDIVNKPAINFMKVIVALLVNVLGDIIAIQLFHQLWAVAFVSILTFLTGVLFGHYMLKKELNYSVKDIIVTGVQESSQLIKKFLAK